MIFRSPYPDVEIPEIPLTAFALRHADRLADKPALIDGANGRTLSYGDLADTVRRVAAGLARRGLRKGDVFAIYAPNSLEYVVAFHGVASLGGIVVPINPAYTVDELSHLLDDAGATYLLTSLGLMDRATEAARRCGIRDVFAFGEAPGATPFASLMASNGDPPIVPIDPRQDVVVLPYSSGTTGLPKGAMRTHFSQVASASLWMGAGELAEDDIVPGHLPFCHIFGIGLTLTYSLSVGATNILMPRYELAPFLRLVQDYGVTRIYAVPPIVVALAKEPIVDDYDLSTVRAVICAAAPLGEMVTRTCAARLGCQVKQAYAMTETGPTFLAPDDVDSSKVGSVGPCMPNTECKLVDVVTGAELGPGQQGEIWARGPAMMKGYLNRPEATAETIDADGWLHTGDIGYADADGYFTIVDRIKELIKYKAYQVAPAELEALLLSHPAVADAAVIPSPDDAAGEVPKAFVVLDGAATAEELMTFVAARVAPYKKVRRLEFVELIPKSPTGKILRRMLVERERAALLSLV